MALRAKMRPDFDLQLDAATARAFFERLRRRLEAEDAPYRSEVLQTHAYVRIPRDRRSMLSPNLNLELLDGGEDGMVLHCRFTPHPSVWLGFMVLFATLGMIALGGLVLGLSQMAVEERPWGFVLVPAGLLSIAFVYGAAFIGQGLVVDEMYELRAFVEDVAREVRSSA